VAIGVAEDPVLVAETLDRLLQESDGNFDWLLAGLTGNSKSRRAVVPFFKAHFEEVRTTSLFNCASRLNTALLDRETVRWQWIRALLPGPWIFAPICHFVYPLLPRQMPFRRFTSEQDYQETVEFFKVFI
jgi:hypothetical protein